MPAHFPPPFLLNTSHLSFSGISSGRCALWWCVAEHGSTGACPGPSAVLLVCDSALLGNIMGICLWLSHCHPVRLHLTCPECIIMWCSGHITAIALPMVIVTNCRHLACSCPAPRRRRRDAIDASLPPRSFAASSARALLTQTPHTSSSSPIAWPTPCRRVLMLATRRHCIAASTNTDIINNMMKMKTGAIQLCGRHYIVNDTTSIM